MRPTAASALPLRLSLPNTQDAVLRSQAHKLVHPSNHKATTLVAPTAAGVPAKRRGGLGDNEASVTKWMAVLDAALQKKNPQPVNIAARDGAAATRIAFTIMDYAAAPAAGEA